MAVEHMVWMKFHPGVTEAAKVQHIEKLLGLAEHVPAISAIRAGVNFTDRAKGFTHGLIVTVDTREDLPRYIEHPVHVQVATALRADAELMAMDIEC